MSALLLAFSRHSVKALLLDDNPSPASTQPKLPKTTAAVSPVLQNTAKRWLRFDSDATKNPAPKNRPETSAAKVTPWLSSTNGTKLEKSSWLPDSRSTATATASEASKTMKRSGSYDRLPAKENQPSYAFKGNTVRGAKRKALPGQTCDNCEEYYKSAGLEGIVNKCSRHRAEHPRVRTPKGMWDLDFPTTPELRARQAALPSPDPQW
ncbi:DNA endonuclease RBBP8-like [Frankliniella occidentalis]|uniref:DNA endonuclease RBBP8-like n=1 Tax=Frankliniella occidentalis TaxID=133901 RepID=A0A9C6X7E5_FRAOC|nr:DNA endonuclease RBBP8-like [Frankliniella occidentalis]